MENNTFITETDEKYVKLQSIKGLIISFLIFSLLACLGFLIAWQTFVFFEIIVLIACAATCLQNKRNDNLWRLEVENDVLTITNLKTNNSFYYRCNFDVYFYICFSLRNYSRNNYNYRLGSYMGSCRV